jgi:hypothetical protein
MKKSARDTDVRVPPAASGSVLVAAFTTLAAAQSAAAGLPGDIEIVGTALRPAPVPPRDTARRIGAGALGGAVAGVAAGAALVLLGVSPVGLVLAGCVLLGAVVGAVRPGPAPAERGVVAGRYELRAPACDADALRDRLRDVDPAELLEFGAVALRARLAAAPLGALDHRVRTADEALGLTPR